MALRVYAEPDTGVDNLYKVIGEKIRKKRKKGENRKKR